MLSRPVSCRVGAIAIAIATAAARLKEHVIRRKARKLLHLPFGQLGIVAQTVQISTELQLRLDITPSTINNRSRTRSQERTD